MENEFHNKHSSMPDQHAIDFTNIYPLNSYAFEKYKVLIKKKMHDFTYVLQFGHLLLKNARKKKTFDTQNICDIL